MTTDDLTERTVRNVRLYSVAALLLMVAVFVVPFRSLATLGRTVGTASSPNQLSIRSANRLRSPGVLAPRLLTSEYGVGSGRKKPPRPSSRWLISVPARPSPIPSRSALQGGELAAFPLRC